MTARITLLFVTAFFLFQAPPLRSQAPEIAGCVVFPTDNVWNVRIDLLPVAANSAAYVTTIGASKSGHADFGSGTWDGSTIGIPFVTVPGTQAKVPVTFDYASESDPGPYPIPPNPPIEGEPVSDGDRHILIVDRDNCVLYELYYAYPNTDGSWSAGSGARFDLRSNILRPAGWTSADAAGLPILPGLIRYDEVASGEIRHAIRFTAPQTAASYIWPARHKASSRTGAQYPPMGQRFRLRANFDMSTFAPEVQVILKAMQNYGIVLADNGSSWFFGGAPDERWNNDHLAQFSKVHGSDFEAVDESSLMVNADSGQTQPAYAVRLALQASSAAGGSTLTQNTVSLDAPAPVGGAIVSLTSSNAAVAGVPPSVTISAGSLSAAFSITTTVVPAAASVTISAFYLGTTSTGTLTVNAAVTEACSMTITNAGGTGTSSLPGTGTSTSGHWPSIPINLTVTPSPASSCPAWTASATSPEGFIKIISGTSGAGVGTVSFNAFANSHLTARSGTVTVTAGTAAPATYTINEAAAADSQLFREVRALYARSLGREPDTGGFNFWTCLTPATVTPCANLGIPGLGRMVDDFLTSSEGMNTGFQVLAIYKAILNRAPTFVEWSNAVLPFRLNDNPAGWLAAGSALANALVNSNEYSTAFGSATNTALVVATLYQNALGRSPGTAEQNNGVVTVSGGGTGGVYALLCTIWGMTPAGLNPSNTEFRNATNPLFVQMLYFAILGRDYAPGDMAGFNFWLGAANAGGPGIYFNSTATRRLLEGPGAPGVGFVGSPEFQNMFAN